MKNVCLWVHTCTGTHGGSKWRNMPNVANVRLLLSGDKKLWNFFFHFSYVFVCACVLFFQCFSLFSRNAGNYFEHKINPDCQSLNKGKSFCKLNRTEMTAGLVGCLKWNWGLLLHCNLSNFQTPTNSCLAFGGLIGVKTLTPLITYNV